MTYSTLSHLSWLDRDLAEGHIASGQPRYSCYLRLTTGGFIRRWSDRRSQALAMHAAAVATPDMDCVITFDHIAIDHLGVDFRPTGKSGEQLRIECDEALERMYHRWAAEEGLG
jgi:hypothetical protein